MTGNLDGSKPDMAGIMPRVCTHIFDHIHSTSSQGENGGVRTQYLVMASYLEIYNEKVFDLLNPNGLKASLDIREKAEAGEFFVEGLVKKIVNSRHDLIELITKGQANRATASTIMNDLSSRSHSILSLVIEKSVSSEGGDSSVCSGKLNLVDLAGSERLTTSVQEKTGKETLAINLSLSTLAKCISALTSESRGYVPYRDSKLTRLLKDSLGGNAKTLMIACIGPTEPSTTETLSTLRYAARAKLIKNKPRINEDARDMVLRKLYAEIEGVKGELAARNRMTIKMFAILHSLAARQQLETLEETLSTAAHPSPHPSSSTAYSTPNPPRTLSAATPPTSSPPSSLDSTISSLQSRLDFLQSCLSSSSSGLPSSAAASIFSSPPPPDPLACQPLCLPRPAYTRQTTNTTIKKFFIY